MRDDSDVDDNHAEDASTPDEEFFAELFEAGGPTEPSAAEVAADRVSAHIEASDVYDGVTQEALILLALAVTKLGGVLVLTPEELRVPYALAIDNRYFRETGGMRLSAWPKQES